MRWLVATVAIAGCSFSGPGGASIDAARGPDAPPADARPDADPDDPDAEPDAQVFDAPAPDAGFSVALCPAAYDRAVGGVPDSVYRYLTTAGDFAVQHADCMDDHPGWTHLAVLDNMTEASGVGAFNMPSYSYIGAVQEPGQSATDDNWFRLTGGPVNTGWSPSGTQPDDSNGSENDQENLGVVASTGNMHDVSGNNPYRAVCECDGKPLNPTIEGYIP